MGKQDAASGFEAWRRPAEVRASFRVEVNGSSCCIAVIFLGHYSVCLCLVFCGAMSGSEERRGELALIKLWLLILRVRAPFIIGHGSISPGVSIIVEVCSRCRTVIEVLTLAGVAYNYS